MKNNKIITGLILGIILIIFGCMNTPSDNGFPLPTITPQTLKPSIVATATPTPTITVPYALPRPTLGAEALTKLIQLLQSESCSLPCYLGIVPGKTTWNEAKTLLENLGAVFVSNTNSDGTIIYETNLDIGDEALAGFTPSPELGVTDVKIIQSLHFIVEDKVVHKIWTSISTRKFISRFQEYWSRYTLRQIFLQFGVPDQILTGKRDAGGIGYGLFAIYEKGGLVFSVSGSAQDGYICPETEKLSIGLEFSVTNPDSGLDLYTPPFKVLPTGRVYVPIDDVLGIDKEEFYSQLISDSQACFKVMPK